eukprot:TRINITY_DN20054_c0_g1_i1.p1 TRINITY_DN20054_c0_g1~~TRINITY_DN20054_c0_g1_i1.p1  ORF type:complete len:712 (+),score=108.49 TRINITY_DN20054_c0_g1_i1:313-2136(+)
MGILVYLVGIYAWIVWATVKYPSRISSGHGIGVVSCYRFLFHRFQPDRYYFGLIYLTRNALVALLPVALTTQPALHVVAMGSVLVLSLTVVTLLMPWRTRLANQADMAMGHTLVFIMLAAGPMLVIDQSGGELIASIMLAFLCLALPTVAFVCVCLLMYARIATNSFYDVFFCHHKKAAGSCVRFLKMLLQQKAQLRAFLDSDELQHLDELLDVVRSKSKNLLIVATPEILRRPWCLAEITVASETKLPTFALECDQCVFPCDEVEEILKRLTGEPRHIMISAGITDELITKALQPLEECCKIRLDRFGSWQEHEQAVQEIVACCKMRRRGCLFNSDSDGDAIALNPDYHNIRKANVLIIGATKDAEGLALSRIILVLLQRGLQVEVGILMSPNQVWQQMPSALYVVVLLQSSIVQDPDCAASLLLLSQLSIDSNRNLRLITIRVDTAFEMPGGAFYEQLMGSGQGPGGVNLLRTVTEMTQLPLDDSGPQMAALYRSIFHVLALPFTPEGSQRLQEQQIREVCNRFHSLRSERKFWGPGTALAAFPSEAVGASATSGAFSASCLGPVTSTTSRFTSAIGEDPRDDHDVDDDLDEVPSSEALRPALFR